MKTWVNISTAETLLSSVLNGLVHVLKATYYSTKSISLDKIII
jgi:hypothetical protein